MAEETGLQPPQHTTPIPEIPPPATPPCTTPTIAQTSGWAKASLILGILGFLCLPSPLAILFGIIGLVNISKSQGQLKGQLSAIIGLCLGGFWMVMAPVIGIIAAIAIPNISMSMTSRLHANEAVAMSQLRILITAESLWRQSDYDGNEQSDYWTYDISCLYRMYKADGKSTVQLIDKSLADADMAPADEKQLGEDTIAPIMHRIAQGIPPTPKSGYLFRVLKLDETGQAYNQNVIMPHWQKIVKAKELGIGIEEPPPGIAATNDEQFAFIAVPTEYGTSGTRIFIVNQDGTIYATDPGSDAKKWIEQWPGDDPSGIAGPGGELWRPVDH